MSEQSYYTNIFASYTYNTIMTLQVTGRDRALYFKRPNLPNVSPLPFVRLNQQDLFGEGSSKRSLGSKNINKAALEKDILPRSKSNGAPSESGNEKSTQTDLRDNETQTKPCSLLLYDDYNTSKTLNKEAQQFTLGKGPKVHSLHSLRYGEGLPITSTFELNVAKDLCDQWDKANHILSDRKKSSSGKRLKGLQNILSETFFIEQRIASQKDSASREMNMDQMCYNLDVFTHISQQMVENRLERLGRQLEYRNRRKINCMRQENEKKMKALRFKCRQINDRLHRPSTAKATHNHSRSNRFYFHGNSDLIRGRKNYVSFYNLDNFKSEMKALNKCERDVNTEIENVVKTSTRLADRANEATKSKNKNYLPRSKKLSSLLDFVYDEMQKRSKLSEDNNEANNMLHLEKKKVKKYDLKNHFLKLEANPQTDANQKKKSRSLTKQSRLEASSPKRKYGTVSRRDRRVDEQVPFDESGADSAQAEDVDEISSASLILEGNNPIRDERSFVRGQDAKIILNELINNILVSATAQLAQQQL